MVLLDIFRLKRYYDNAAGGARMKFTLARAVLCVLLGTAFANDGAIRANKCRFADASSDACMSSEPQTCAG